MNKKISIFLIIISVILILIGLLLLFNSNGNTTKSNQEEIKRLTKELVVEGTELKFIKEDKNKYYFEGYKEDSEEKEYEIIYHKKTKKIDFISLSTESGGGV